jgi:hypothetical protein
MRPDSGTTRGTLLESQCTPLFRVLSMIFSVTFMAILKFGHNGHYGYFILFYIMAGLNMAINNVFMGVFSKTNKNADQLPKRFLKICVWHKVMTKTNFSPKLWQFPLYFGLILQRVYGTPKYARIFMKFVLVLTLI